MHSPSIVGFRCMSLQALKQTHFYF